MASPPFSIAELVPVDSDFVRNFPALERTFRDVVESWLTGISDATTGYPKQMLGTDAERLALSPAPGSGTTFFTTDTYNRWIRVAGNWVCEGTQPGTMAIFLQETAPLGWTKVTDAEIDQAIIELSIGTDGGDYAGSTAIIEATLAQANLPSVNFAVTGTAGSDGAHTHSVTGTTDDPGVHGHPFRTAHDSGGADDATGGLAMDAENDQNEAAFTGTPSATRGEQIGGGGAHTHAVTGTAASGGAHTHSVTGNAASGGSATAYLSDVKRVVAIVCVKD